MPSNKLYTLLKNFSKEDLKSAKKFLASPYFNNDEQVVRLFDRLCRSHPGMDDPSLENERLFKSLFPKLKQYDDHKLRNLRSKLIKLLEEFMIVEGLRNNPDMACRLLVTAYREASLFPYFKIVIESRIKTLEKGANRSIEYHEELAWLLRQFYYFNPLSNGNPRARSRIITDLIRHWETYFTLQSLCFGSSYTVWQQLLEAGSPSHYLEHVKMVAEKVFSKDKPPVRLMLQLLNTGTQPDAKFDFLAMKKSLLEQEQVIGPYVFAMAWQLLTNAGVVRSNRGEVDATKALLDLYQFSMGHRQDRLKNQDAQGYLNCITAGAHAGEFDWTERFIHESLPNFNEEIREQARNLSYAILFYHKARRLKDPVFFTKASEKLSLLPHADEIFGLTIRPLGLRIHYDSLPIGHPDLQLLFGAARNAAAFFNNHAGLAAKKRIEYKNFVRHLKEMAKLKSKPVLQEEELERYRSQLLAEDTIILKIWLLEKLEELKNPSSLDWLQS